MLQTQKHTVTIYNHYRQTSSQTTIWAAVLVQHIHTHTHTQYIHTQFIHTHTVYTHTHNLQCFTRESTGCVFPQCSYLGGLVDVDSVVQSQTLRQLHATAPLQTLELEENGHWQQLQDKKRHLNLWWLHQIILHFFFKNDLVWFYRDGLRVWESQSLCSSTVQRLHHQLRTNTHPSVTRHTNDKGQEVNVCLTWKAL